jgi:HEPN domain-containing protein
MTWETLGPYAVSSRYPGEDEPVGKSEYEQALKVAEMVVAWAAAQIQA